MLDIKLTQNFYYTVISYNCRYFFKKINTIISIAYYNIVLQNMELDLCLVSERKK